MAQKKQLTNDKMIMNLVKELSTTAIGNALLRERLMDMVDRTRLSLKTQPNAWKNGIISPALYEDLCDRIEKHLGYND
jgi:hypothetical protein